MPKQSIAGEEQAFVTLVFAHISSVYYAMNDLLVINLDGLRRDIVQFLSLPNPRGLGKSQSASERRFCGRRGIMPE